MKNKLIILSCIFLFLSCESDDQNKNFTYDGLYQSNRFENSNARLYTISGEINNQNIISDYIQRHNIQFVVNSNETEIDVNENVQIEFVINDAVNLTLNNTLENRNLIDNGDYFYLESIDTTFYTRELAPKQPNIFDIIKHFPIYESTEQIGLNQLLVHHKHCYYVKKESGIIKTPILGYHLYDITENPISLDESSVWNLNNEFNFESLNYIQENDTLLIQERNLIFEKQ